MLQPALHSLVYYIHGNHGSLRLRFLLSCLLILCFVAVCFFDIVLMTGALSSHTFSYGPCTLHGPMVGLRMLSAFRLRTPHGPMVGLHMWSALIVFLN